jgi:roadblock/LC7 domain-containing protein
MAAALMVAGVEWVVAVMHGTLGSFIGGWAMAAALMVAGGEWVVAVMHGTLGSFIVSLCAIVDA